MVYFQIILIKRTLHPAANRRKMFGPARIAPVIEASSSFDVFTKYSSCLDFLLKVFVPKDNSCGHTTRFYLGKINLARENLPEFT